MGDNFGDDFGNSFDNGRSSFSNDLDDASMDGFSSIGNQLNQESSSDEESNTNGILEIIKNSKKIIILGIAVIILIIIVAIVIKNVSKSRNKLSDTSDVSETVNSKRSEIKVENNQNHTVIDDSGSWLIVDANQDVIFNEEYTDTTFVITKITHKARKVDDSGTIEIKTTLDGTISGLNGTYKLDIPYSMGSKINGTGDSFKVKVLLGQYNGKTVIGDILY